MSLVSHRAPVASTSQVQPARRPIATSTLSPLRSIRRYRPSKLGRPQRRSLFVQTENTPNEDSIKFVPGVPVTTNGSTHEFTTPTSALVSPLAVSLFSINGVKSVFYGPDFVTINKEPEASWALMKPEIFSFLMEHFTAGTDLFRSGSAESQGLGPEDTRILPDDSETVAMIKELLDTRVRPAIQEDGGDIEYRGFIEDTGIVNVSLKGSCRGCDSSTVTLKSGIERMLTHYIPEVKAVEQVLGEEEKVSLSEFEKFEERLRSGGKTVSI
ncbi:uncharacterized protein L969DRAFT_88825 [Mixia osmundae IAM 14324]|nr:uncharacterized protein L969DRAFT_88825 [Mixia osmundae IAM 14324]KEI38385.1 hypothetical protein L969DRAFT_88825 [Mixia osmundae IAM 14324]